MAPAAPPRPVPPRGTRGPAATGPPSGMSTRHPRRRRDRPAATRDTEDTSKTDAFRAQVRRQGPREPRQLPPRRLRLARRPPAGRRRARGRGQGRGSVLHAHHRRELARLSGRRVKTRSSTQTRHQRDPPSSSNPRPRPPLSRTSLSHLPHLSHQAKPTANNYHSRLSTPTVDRPRRTVRPHVGPSRFA